MVLLFLLDHERASGGGYCFYSHVAAPVELWCGKSDKEEWEGRGRSRIRRKELMLLPCFILHLQEVHRTVPARLGCDKEDGGWVRRRKRRMWILGCRDHLLRKEKFVQNVVQGLPSVFIIVLVVVIL
jgi:hypothetical protein